MNGIFIADRVRNITQDIGGVIPSGDARVPDILEESGHRGVSFGPAYVRDSERHGFSFASYTRSGVLDRPSKEEELADQRMLAKLEQRDRDVRETEKAKGEAVGGSGYIFQVGPDGKRYATGTAMHTVRAEKGALGGSATGANAFGLERGPDGKPLGESEQRLVEDLEARDAKVRAHEAAHVMAAGGQAAGMPTYT